MTVLRYASLTGSLIKQSIEAVAKLRMEIFRSWPYLYDGTLEYERNYLARMSSSKDAVVVIAQYGQSIVGAATGSPLATELDEFKRPFVERGMNVDEIFYCAESVLAPSFRGRGAGHAFFDLREAHARKAGAKQITFCSVVRPDTHPKRTGDSAFLDSFWRKRGYEPQPGLVTEFSWRDVGQTDETAKPMQFWMKSLA